MGYTVNCNFILSVGTRIQILSGNDKGKVFVILSDLLPCARTEGCYRAKYEDTGLECYIYPSYLHVLGFKVLA